MTTSAAEVAIIYRFLPEWRVRFFHGLRDNLAANNIKLRLIYGRNRPGQDGRRGAHRLKWGSEVDLDWGTPVPNRLWNVGKYELVWQRLPKDLRPDLLILMQESSILSNYSAALRQSIHGKKVALWGHGINSSESKDSFANRFKSLYSSRVDWWFAYTSGVAEDLEKLGFPARCITVVNNAIDTLDLVGAAQNTDPRNLDSLRRDLGLSSGPVGIFCGAMYPSKEIDFLTQACDQIREQVPNFQMLLIGSGSDAPIAQRFAERRHWAHYIGPKYGTDRVPYFLISDVFLMPGAVGLAILDCFALETPLITTACRTHGPEIDYLEAGVDGLISPHSLDAYVSAAVKVLESNELLQRLKAGCRAKALDYTIGKMVDRFSDGVRKALTST